MSKGKTYRVTGAAAYRGHAPGTSFTAELDEAAERRAIARGSITVESGGGEDEEHLEDKTRDELDEIAARLGVENPGGLDNKAAVIDAIRSYDKE